MFWGICKGTQSGSSVLWISHRICVLWYFGLPDIPRRRPSVASPLVPGKLSTCGEERNIESVYPHIMSRVMVHKCLCVCVCSVLVKSNVFIDKNDIRRVKRDSSSYVSRLQHKQCYYAPTFTLEESAERGGKSNINNTKQICSKYMKYSLNKRSSDPRPQIRCRGRSA